MVIDYFSHYFDVNAIGALEDFDKPPKTVVKDDTKESTDLAESNLLEELESGKAWSEDFIKQTADQLEKSFEKVLQNGEKIVFQH